MKPILLFAELEPERSAQLPSISELAGKLSAEHKAAVLEYLAHGVAVLDVMEATPDPLRPGHLIPGGASLITDGSWVWRLDLSNYIAAHSLELPPEFIAQAVSAVKSRSFPVVNPEACVAQALAAYGWA